MFDKEREMVELGPHSYNLKPGGEGGFEYVNDTMSQSTRAEIGRLGGVKCKTMGLGFFKESREERSERLIKYGVRGWLSEDHQRKATDAARSDSAIIKRKETFARIKHQQGERHSQYGTMWITDGIANRKIKKDAAIPEGWRKGRQIKSR